MNAILVGAVSTATLVAGLFFLRYWRSTGDRFFLLFALSFLIEATNRVVLFLAIGLSEDSAIYYLVRLVSYGLILFAVYEKNRKARD